ncbi:ectodysplasin-A isoform X1 [Arapaima gigas]
MRPGCVGKDEASKWQGGLGSAVDLSPTLVCQPLLSLDILHVERPFLKSTDDRTGLIDDSKRVIHRTKRSKTKPPESGLNSYLGER